MRIQLLGITVFFSMLQAVDTTDTSSKYSNINNPTDVIPDVIHAILSADSHSKIKTEIHKFFDQEIQYRINARKQESPQLAYIQNNTYHNYYPYITCYDSEDFNAPLYEQGASHNEVTVKTIQYDTTRNELAITVHPDTIFLLPAYAQFYITQLEENWDRIAQPRITSRTNWCLDQHMAQYVQSQCNQVHAMRRLESTLCCGVPRCIPNCTTPITSFTIQRALSNVASHKKQSDLDTTAHYDSKPFYSYYALHQKQIECKVAHTKCHQDKLLDIAIQAYYPYITKTRNINEKEICTAINRTYNTCHALITCSNRSRISNTADQHRHIGGFYGNTFISSTDVQ